jgi:predicted XRE-type DNA-binding protein
MRTAKSARISKVTKAERSLVGTGAVELWAELRAATTKLKGKPAGMLPPDATALERTKYDLCKRLLIYMREHELTQRELAKRLGVVESRVSEVLHYRIHKISLDRLVKYHQALDPKFLLKVA